MASLTKLDFQEMLWRFYDQHGRHGLPWRQAELDGSFNPYKILVSELMLQQTQVSRVVPKFQQFLLKFPSVQSLAAAPLAEVLVAWSGLGYNRRAKYLQQAAQKIVTDYSGQFPSASSDLISLPGVGKNTAGAIAAYAFNQPVVFIETNIRTVFIHHFFSDRTDITDGEILQVVEEMLDHEHPREFYWALMDYGSHLKQTVGNLNIASRSYAKQSKFHGSRRQVRGQVLQLLRQDKLTRQSLTKQISDQRLADVLNDLVQEGLIQASGDWYHL